MKFNAHGAEGRLAAHLCEGTRTLVRTGNPHLLTRRHAAPPAHSFAPPAANKPTRTAGSQQVQMDGQGSHRATEEYIYDVCNVNYHSRPDFFFLLSFRTKMLKI